MCSVSHKFLIKFTASKVQQLLFHYYIINQITLYRVKEMSRSISVSEIITDIIDVEVRGDSKRGVLQGHLPEQEPKPLIMEYSSECPD